MVLNCVWSIDEYKYLGFLVTIDYNMSKIKSKQPIHKTNVDFCDFFTIYHQNITIQFKTVNFVRYLNNNKCLVLNRCLGGIIDSWNSVSEVNLKIMDRTDLVRRIERAQINCFLSLIKFIKKKNYQRKDVEEDLSVYKLGTEGQ